MTRNNDRLSGLEIYNNTSLSLGEQTYVGKNASVYQDRTFCFFNFDTCNDHCSDDNPDPCPRDGEDCGCDDNQLSRR